jgi:mannonate dehydratase
MPVLDWMRTDPEYELPDGSKAMHFEKAALIAFDMFLLKRPGAEKDYTREEVKQAEACFLALTPVEKDTLYRNTLLGLPGRDEQFTEAQILDAIQSYRTVDHDNLRENLFYFLNKIIPVADRLGLKMALHPDDPPFPVLGLPRVVCTDSDLQKIADSVSSLSNGFCFCTGSLGVLEGNNLPGMIRRFGDRIHFLHLRNTQRDQNGNFFEADHLGGDTDMAEVMKEVLLLMQRNGSRIPMRPDHGHQMLDDLRKKTNPGYSAIGRLKGLAELRGLELGISRFL